MTVILVEVVVKEFHRNVVTEKRKEFEVKKIVIVVVIVVATADVRGSSIIRTSEESNHEESYQLT